MIYGALFLAIILVLPRGIVTTAQERWRIWRAAHKAQLSKGTHATSQDQTTLLIEQGGEG